MLRTWPFVLLTAGALALGALACAGEEEVAGPTPEETPAVTLPPLGTPLPTVTLPPLPTVVTGAGCPTPVSPTIMFLAGPTEAKLGEQVTYQLSYALPGLHDTAIRIDWSEWASYVSSRRISGAGAPGPELDSFIEGKAAGLSWLVEEGSGMLEYTLSLPLEASSDALYTRAWVTGVCAPRSNGAQTTIVRG